MRTRSSTGGVRAAGAVEAGVLFVLSHGFRSLRMVFVGGAHLAEEAPHLRRRESRGARVDGQFHSFVDDEMTPHLHRPGAPPPRWRTLGRRIGQQLGDALQREPRLLPLPDLEQLPEVPLAVARGPRLALGPVHQAELDVVADRAFRQFDQGRELGERIGLAHGCVKATVKVAIYAVAISCKPRGRTAGDAFERRRGSGLEPCRHRGRRRDGLTPRAPPDGIFVCRRDDRRR